MFRPGILSGPQLIGYQLLPEVRLRMYIRKYFHVFYSHPELIVDSSLSLTVKLRIQVLLYSCDIGFMSRANMIKVSIVHVLRQMLTYKFLAYVQCWYVIHMQHLSGL